MKKIVFVSYQPSSGAFDYHYEDEELLAQPLARRGIQVETRAWDSDTDWASYDVLIIRSTWDYHHRFDEFLPWLKRMTDLADAGKFQMFNSAKTILWNLDKAYLAQLVDKGVRFLQTEFVAQGQSADLAATIIGYGWRDAVVKPTISAGGDNTWRVTLDQAPAKQAELDTLLTRSGVMIQQFADQISVGEYSFLFFNGVYSHAVRKIPATGDMFVHAHRGGRTHNYHPTAELVAQASHIVRVTQGIVGEIPLYARVDGVIEGDTLVLMELELFEPYLYFPYTDEYGLERFADAIAQRI